MNVSGEPLSRQLTHIMGWVSRAPKPAELRNEQEFMTALCDAMASALYLLRTSVAVAQSDAVAERGVPRQRAIVVAHMVRLCKLFDAFYLHVAQDQMEIAGLLLRPLYETEIRLSYLVARGTRKSMSSYVLASYRPEKDCLLDLKSKAEKRPLTAIEKRIQRRIRRALREDGIRESTLLKNKVWDMDGKSTRTMLRDLGREWEYGYGFGGQSRWVHGTWLELKNYHLTRKGRYYLPELNWGAVDTRTAAPGTMRCLDFAARYLAWSKGDPDRIVRRVISALSEWILAVDTEHERRIQDEAH